MWGGRPSPTVCKYFAQGNCKHGSRCKFSHAHQSNFVNGNSSNAPNRALNLIDADEQIRCFQRFRRQIIQEEHFLNYKELESRLHEEFGETRTWSKRLVDACNGIRRMLASIELSIDAAIATHQILTLHDLQSMIMENKDFKELDSFENVQVGSLLHHRKIVTFFRPSETVRSRLTIPQLSSIDVMNKFLEEMRPGGLLQQIRSSMSDEDDTHEVYKTRISSVLTDLALSKGYSEETDLCVFLKGHSFIIWLLSFSRRHMNDVEFSFKHALSDAAEEYDENAMKDATALHIDLMEAYGMKMLRGPAAWWNSVRRRVRGLNDNLALAFVERCLTTYPRISKLDAHVTARGQETRRQSNGNGICHVGVVDVPGSTVEVDGSSSSPDDDDAEPCDDSGSEHKSLGEESCGFSVLQGVRNVRFRSGWGLEEMRFNGMATVAADCCCPPSYKAYFEIEILDMRTAELTKLEKKQKSKTPERQKKAAISTHCRNAGPYLDSDSEGDYVSSEEEDEEKDGEDEVEEDEEKYEDEEEDWSGGIDDEWRPVTTLLRCGFVLPSFRASRGRDKGDSDDSAASSQSLHAFEVGDRVVLSATYMSCRDARYGPLIPDQVGFVVEVDADSDERYLVSTTRFGGGSQWWYQQKALYPKDCEPDIDHDSCSTDCEADCCGLGGDSLSWAWDGVRQSLLHNGKKGRGHCGAAWTPGTVLGIACDMESRRLRLSVDGRFDDDDRGGFEVPQGRFRLIPALAMDHGRVRCNLGGEKFRFAPPGEGFLSFAALKLLLHGEGGSRYEEFLLSGNPNRTRISHEFVEKREVGRAGGRELQLKPGDLVMLARDASAIPVGGNISRFAEGLKQGEVGWLIEVDRKSPPPYRVCTMRGDQFWYDEDQLIFCARAADDNTSMKYVQMFAPLVLCSLRRIPLSSPAARQLCSFDTDSVVHIILKRLSDAGLRLRLSDVEALAMAEADFLAACGGSIVNGGLTLLGLLQSHDLLSVLLLEKDSRDITLSGTTVQDCQAVSRVDSFTLADTLVDIFQQQFKCDNKDEDGVQNGGIIPVLARVETRVCEVYGSGSFLALSGGVSFAAFCAEHCAAHLVCGSSPYLDSAHRISGAGSVQTQLEGKRLSRLLEVAFLASALSDKASFGSNESATLDEGARNGVAETTFKGDDLVVMKRVRQAVERHFDSRLDSLGFSDPAAVLEEARHFGVASAGEGTSFAWPIHAAECLVSSDPREIPAEESQETMLHAAALEVKWAPMLVDLSEWLDWRSRYFECLGPFRLCIAQLWHRADSEAGRVSAGAVDHLFHHKQRSGEGWTASTDTCASGPTFIILEVSEGHFVKVPDRPDMASFQLAVEAMESSAAAAAALGMVVRLGGVDALAEQFALLAELVETHLAASRQQPFRAAGFVFAATRAIPQVLRLQLGVPLFVDPFVRVMPGADRLLLDQCNSIADFAALRQIGLFQGRRAWMQDSAGGMAAMTERLNVIAKDLVDYVDVCPSPDNFPVSSIGNYEPNLKAGFTESQTAVDFVTPSDMSLIESYHGRLHPDTEKICLAVRHKFGLAEGQGPPNLEFLALLNRAIKGLAAELYAKDVHFVLELIQNCDDNSYNANVVPTLRIEVANDFIAFRNNEKGFSEKDVIAICSIGESSKHAQTGYIGQKGIGFKSVFKVTEKPRVHSRTYHFEFRAPSVIGVNEKMEIGYIIPAPLPVPNGFDTTQGTSIVLPFSVPVNSGRGNGGLQDARKLAAKVCDIEGSLLLFLNKLRRLEVADSSRKILVERAMHRVDEGRGIICIEERALGDLRTERWHVTERVLQASIPRDESGSSVKSTRLAIAIPLLSEADLRRPPPRDVCAFLPLRSYGFRWVLQGDFVVPSSREAVDGSRAWNQWLLHETPGLFIEAIIRLSALGEEGAILQAPLTRESDSVNESSPLLHIDTVYAARLIFAMIPLHGQVTDFFAIVPRAITERLRDCAFVPVTSSIGSGSCGLVRPSKAIRRPLGASAAMQQYTESLLNLLGLSFVRADIEVPTDVAQEIGIYDLAGRLPEVLACACHCWTESWTEGNEGDSSARIGFNSEWLVHALEVAAAVGPKRLGALCEQLRAIPFVPLARGGGAFAKLSDEEVFELEDATAAEFPALARLGRVMNLEFHAALASSREATVLLRRLGVRSIGTEAFVLQHLVPALADPISEPGDLIQMLAYAKSAATVIPGLAGGRLERAMHNAGALLVDARGGKLRAGSRPIHFGPGYGTYHVDAQQILPLHVEEDDDALFKRWPMVSDGYVEQDGDVEGWVQLLRALGVTAFIQVDDTAAFRSKELENLLSDLSVNDNFQRLVRLFAYFVKFWEAEYEELAALLNQSRDSPACSIANSSFLEVLRSATWVPGTDGKLHVPCDVFSSTASDAKELFAEWAVFVLPAAEVGLERKKCKSFYDNIGLSMELTPQLAIQVLNVRCAKAPCMKISDLKRVYKFLEHKWKDLEDSETDPLPLIFVPNRATASCFDIKGKEKHFKLLENVEIPGFWVTPAKCVWFDPAYLVDSLKVVVGGFNITHEMNNLATSVTRALHDYYGENLQPFFTQKLHVSVNPTSYMYIEIMRRAANEYPTAESHAVACILRVINHFVYNLQNSRAEQASDYEEHSDYILIKQHSSDISVPAATFKNLVSLEDVCWCADSITSNLFEIRGFGHTVLKKCVPIDYTLDCPFKVSDSGGTLHGKRDTILIHDLNKMQNHFYDEVWRVPKLSALHMQSRIDVLPSTEVVCEWPPARSAAEFVVCHILSRALQRWSRKHVSDPAERDAIRASVVALSLVVVNAPVCVRRRWVFVSPQDGSEIDSSNVVETKKAVCALDRVDACCPRLFVMDCVLALDKDLEELAQCFSELVTTDSKGLVDCLEACLMHAKRQSDVDYGDSADRQYKLWQHVTTIDSEHEVDGHWLNPSKLPKPSSFRARVRSLGDDDKGKAGGDVDELEKIDVEELLRRFGGDRQVDRAMSKVGGEAGDDLKEDPALLLQIKAAEELRKKLAEMRIRRGESAATEVVAAPASYSKVGDNDSVQRDIDDDNDDDKCSSDGGGNGCSDDSDSKGGKIETFPLREKNWVPSNMIYQAEESVFHEGGGNVCLPQYPGSGLFSSLDNGPGVGGCASEETGRQRGEASSAVGDINEGGKGHIDDYIDQMPSQMVHGALEWILEEELAHARHLPPVRWVEAGEMPSDRALAAIGRWGEEFVYLLLKSKYKEYACTWVNRAEESGKPYDLVLKRKKCADGQSGTEQGGLGGGCEDDTVYVEVKSTTSGPEVANSPFPISLPELLFADQQKERFQLFRVFRAGTRTASVLAMSDFYCRLVRASQLYCQISVAAASGGGA